jgi:hypothetical protein
LAQMECTQRQVRVKPDLSLFPLADMSIPEEDLGLVQARK